MCGLSKPNSHYRVKTSSKLGRDTGCKSCRAKVRGKPRAFYFDKTEVNSWPENYRGCTKCKEVKPFSDFKASSKGGEGPFGRHPRCKKCTRVVSASDDRLRKRMLQGAKDRAKAKQVPFDLVLEDIQIPQFCPVFGVPMTPRTKYAPSLDRLNPSLGYVQGNISVMSRRANTLKRDATLEELEKVVKFLNNASGFAKT